MTWPWITRTNLPSDSWWVTQVPMARMGVLWMRSYWWSLWTLPFIPKEIVMRACSVTLLTASCVLGKVMRKINCSRDNSLKNPNYWTLCKSGGNQKPALFDCFQPYDICESNLIIANNLIVFQCLSNHTWLLRKILKQLKKTEIHNSNPNTNIADLPNQYSIEMYFNDEIKKVIVDEYIPFLKER